MVAAVRTEPETAGARLASARERLGLSLDQVADHLKLDRHMVVALEEGDHRAIGAAVFVRGFLRRYAALVGESSAEIEALYARRPDAEAQPDLSKTGMQRIEPASFRPRLGVLPALIAALVLAVAGAAWWVLYSHPHARSSSTVTVVLPAAPAPLTPTSAGPPATDGDAGGQLVAAETKPEALPGRHKLQLSFTGECWAEIYDARGVRLFFGFGHTGTSQELNGVAPFRLVLGNGQAVTLTMEGNEVTLPASVPGRRVRVLLGADGAATALP
jgi:cytoskeleton protein RodZ